MTAILLDLLRLVALTLIGAGIYMWAGATVALIYSGVALLLAAAVVEMRNRRVQ